MHQWNIYNNFDSASVAAAEFIADKIKQCCQQQDQCHVVLPGGNTPASCLSELASMNLPWERIHWYVGDERVCAKDDEQRNDLMLEKNFWSKLPAGNFHTIATELGMEQAIDEYTDVINKVEKMDIAFLGLGEDGHTASLFPDNKALENTSSVVAVYDSPKPPPLRVSLGLSYLRESKLKMILAAGAGKAAVLKSIKQGVDFPVNKLGDIHWFVDQQAMPVSTDSTD